MSPANSGKTLPIELTKRIHQLLFNDGLYGTLANCARVNEVFGASAVEELYSRIMSWDEAAGRPDRFPALVVHWRSLLMSTVSGETYYPYCEFVKTLEVFTVRAHLELLFRYPWYTQRLFAPPLRELATATINPEIPDNRNEAARRIFARLFSSCKSLRSIVGFPNLEAFAPCRPGLLSVQHLSLEVTPPISRLPDIASLVENLGVANTSLNALHLRRNPPSERDLWRSSYGDGDSNTGESYDHHLGRCLTSLVSSSRPGDLREFSLTGDDFSLGDHFLSHLASYGTSLAILKLSLTPQTFNLLPRLSVCTQLKELGLASRRLVRGPPFSDFDSALPSDSKDFPQPLCDKIVGWLSACHLLTELDIHRFYLSPRLFVPLLTGEQSKLSRLEVRFEDEEEPDTTSALVAILQSQPHLSSLSLRGRGPGDWTRIHSTICSLRSLTTLKLDGPWRFFELSLPELFNNLDRLTHFEVDGEFVFRPSEFAILGAMRRAQEIRITCASSVGHPEILAFLQQLSPESRGIHLAISYNHAGRARYTSVEYPRREAELQERFTQTCNGRLTIKYWD